MNAKDHGAELSSSQIKAILRKHCSGSPQSGGLEQALAGVELSLKPGAIQISFIHPYLASYYRKNHLPLLETLVRDCFDARLQFLENRPAAAPPDFCGQSQPVDPFSGFLTNSRTLDTVRACARASNPKIAGAMLLIICGPPGSGKSHLLSCMYKAMLKAKGPAKVTKSSALAFASSSRPDSFWQQGSALLLDDLQDLLPEPKLQATLANHLDIVLDKDEPGWRRVALAFGGQPAQLRNFSPRLAHRIQAGLVLELFAADLSMKISYLENRTKEENLKLTHEQLLSLARHAQGIGPLNGFLQKLGFYAKTGDRVLTVEALEKLTLPANQSPAWQAIIQKVAQKLNLKPGDLTGMSRKHEVAQARQIAMCLCRTKLRLSYPELGRLFGGRDHSTVLYAIRKIQQLRHVDKVLHNLMTELEIDCE